MWSNVLLMCYWRMEDLTAQSRALLQTKGLMISQVPSNCIFCWLFCSVGLFFLLVGLLCLFNRTRLTLLRASWIGLGCHCCVPRSGGWALSIRALRTSTRHVYYMHVCVCVLVCVCMCVCVYVYGRAVWLWRPGHWKPVPGTYVCLCVCVWIMAVSYGFDDPGIEDQYLANIFRYRYVKNNPHGKTNSPAERGRERGSEGAREVEQKHRWQAKTPPQYPIWWGGKRSAPYKQIFSS